MEITGKIIIALPEMSGTSKAGNAWKKREYVLETQETYPKKVFFNFFGDRVDQYPLNVGDEVTVSFDIDSREFNGRWYTDIRAWKAEKAGVGSSCRSGRILGRVPGRLSSGPGRSHSSRSGRRSAFLISDFIRQYDLVGRDVAAYSVRLLPSYKTNRLYKSISAK